MQRSLSRRLVKHITYSRFSILLTSVAGVSTNIGRDIDRDSFDMEAFETMKPVQLAHMPDQSKGPRITSEEVARVLVFLVSGLSSRVNGAVIPVDDAWSTI